MHTLNFRPAAATTINYFVTEGAQTLPHLIPAAGFYLTYAHKPLQIWDVTHDETYRSYVEHQLSLDLNLAMGLWDFLEVGLGLPVALYQHGDQQDLFGSSDTVGSALGDLRLIVKGRLLTLGPVSVGLAVPVSFPTGSEDNLTGQGGVTVTPTAVLGLSTRWVDAALNAGYRFRPEQSITVAALDQDKINVDDEVVLSLGLKVPVWQDRIDLIADGFVSLSTHDLDSEEVPAEVLGGLRFHLPAGLTAHMGAGPGISGGIGTPTFRVFAGLGYQYVPPKVVPPPPDRDGDGIVDADDRCPDDPEDTDGFEDQDGCPDPDNDQDKILDPADKCPNDPETYNEFEDADGCPDAKPAAKVQITRTAITVPTVYFDTNKDSLQQRSHQTLKEVAALLQKNEWVKKVRLEGHTDDRGDDAYNMDLSQRRMATVKQFLMDQGVAADRLEAKGYGETKPIADNKTAKGRAQNRRVEFVIVDPAAK